MTLDIAYTGIPLPSDWRLETKTRPDGIIDKVPCSITLNVHTTPCYIGQLELDCAFFNLYLRQHNMMQGI